MCGNLTSSLFPLQNAIFTETVDRARHHIRLGVGHIYIFSNRIHSDAVWMFYGRIRTILDEISVEHFIVAMSILAYVTRFSPVT